MLKTLKTIAASMLIAFAMFATPVIAQEISPSGDTCWVPVETQPVLEAQGYKLVQTLTEEEVATVKGNLMEINPDLILTFTYMEIYTVENNESLKDTVFVALYTPEVEGGEPCFWNFFAQTEAQVAELMKP